MDFINKKICDTMNPYGYQAKMVSISRLPELQDAAFIRE
jgi:hypothetical protein